MAEPFIPDPEAVPFRERYLPAVPDIEVEPPPGLPPKEDIVEPVVNEPDQRIPYDLEAAYRSGMTMRQLASLLSEDAGMDYDALHGDGFSDEEIVERLVITRETTPDKAILEGVGRGVTQFGPAMAGAKLAATASLPLAPLAGPFAPAVPFVAGTLGFGAGLWAGTELEDAMFSEVPISPTVRPYMEGARTFGENLSLLTMPWAFPAKASALPQQLRYLNPLRKTWGGISRTAKERPLTFGAAELSANTTSALGAYLAEKSSPGKTAPRIGYEIMGGVLNPTTLLLNQSVGIGQGAARALERFTEAGRDRAAARLLVGAMDQLEDDPQALLKLFGEEDELAKFAKELGVEYTPRSAAQLTGARTFVLIEQALSRNNAKYSNQVRNAINTNLAGAQRMIDMMIQTGDPKLIEEASKIKKRLVTNIVEARLAQALDEADHHVSKLKIDDPEAVEEAGKRVHTIVKQALDDVADQRNALWEAVDQTLPADARNIEEVFGEHEDIFAAYMETKPSQYPPVIRSYLEKIFRADVAPEEAAAKISVAARKAQGKVTSSQDKIQDLADKFPDDYRAFQEAAQGAGLREYARRPEEVRRALAGRLPLGEEVADPLHPRVLRGEGEDTGTFVVALEGEAEPFDPVNFDALTDQLAAITRAGRAKGASAVEKRIAQFAELESTSLQNQRRVMEESALAAAERRVAAPPGEGAAEPIITLRDLKLFRSQMGNEAATARAAQDWTKVNIYGDMAAAAQRDIEAISVDGRSAEVIDAFNTAKAFSKAEHDAFTRSFGGKILRRTGAGEQRIDPELLHEALTQGSSSATALRMNQLREALELTAEEGGGISPAQIKRLLTLRDAEELILREGARNVIDTTTGRVNVRALNNWLDKNRRSLKDFPDLVRDLSDARTAEILFKQLGDTQSLAFKKMEASAVWHQFLGTNDRNPIRVLDMALADGKGAGGDPIRALTQLAKMASNKPLIREMAKKLNIPEGVDAEELIKRGFRDSFLDRAYVYAGGTGDSSLNFGAFRDWLFKPVEAGQPSRMKVMRDFGIIDEADAGRLNVLVREAEKIQKSLLSGEDIGEMLVDAPQAIVDLVERLAGSTLGTELGRKAPGRGSGILEATAGIRLVKNYWNKVPATQLREILWKASQDPEQMALMIEKGMKQQKRKAIDVSRRVHTWLQGAGFDLLPLDPDELEYVPEEEYRPVEPPSRGISPRPTVEDIGYPQLYRPPSPPTPTAPPPQAMAPPQPPAPPMPSPQGQSVPQPPPGEGVTPERSQYAAYFPNDPISGLIRQQEQMGIAALMQQMQGQQQA